MRPSHCALPPLAEAKGEGTRPKGDRRENDGVERVFRKSNVIGKMVFYEEIKRKIKSVYYLIYFA